MIEWLSEIGVTILLVLLIASMYVVHLSMINLLLVRTEVEVVKFVTESGLVRVLLKIDDLLLVKKIYLNKYNRTLGLKILPAFNITIANNGTGFTMLCVTSWSGHIPPSLNYSLMKIVLNETGIESVKSEKGIITLCVNSSLEYDSSAIYVATISCCRLITFKIFAPSGLIRDNYNASNNELYNASNVLEVYAIIPPYSELVPVNFTRYNDHVKLKVEYGTVAFIIIEKNGIYVVHRFPIISFGNKFRKELCKYIVCEYYTLIVMVGERA